MTERHRIQKTAGAYAAKHFFRLRRNDRGTYTLVNSTGADIDCPATGETTAAGALRMMRRHLRQNRTDARAIPRALTAATDAGSAAYAAGRNRVPAQCRTLADLITANGGRAVDLITAWLRGYEIARDLEMQASGKWPEIYGAP